MRHSSLSHSFVWFCRATMHGMAKARAISHLPSSHSSQPETTSEENTVWSIAARVGIMKWRLLFPPPPQRVGQYWPLMLAQFLIRLPFLIFLSLALPSSLDIARRISARERFISSFVGKRRPWLRGWLSSMTTTRVDDVHVHVGTAIEAKMKKLRSTIRAKATLQRSSLKLFLSFLHMYTSNTHTHSVHDTTSCQTQKSFFHVVCTPTPLDRCHPLVFGYRSMYTYKTATPE